MEYEKQYAVNRSIQKLRRLWKPLCVPENLHTVAFM